METPHIILIWISVSLHFIAIIAFLWQFSKLSKWIASCCNYPCVNTHQESHLDTHTLRVHYKRDTGVVIEGLDNCNIVCDQEDKDQEVHLGGDIRLSPLPHDIRDQCPSSACQVSYN